MHNDNWQDAVEIPGSQLNGYVDDMNDNIGASEQDEESLDCGGSPFGSTLWWEFRPPVNGQVTVSSAGIDSVIWVMPFDADFFYYNDADAACQDSPDRGVSEQVTTYVRSNIDWNIQVGGYDEGTGAEEGTVTLRTSFVPDTDGDRVLDPNDNCPSQSGGINGCPDTDNDGIADPQDECDNARGPNSLGGCPDSDGDGRRDIDDKCPTENAAGRDSTPRDGCLDIIQIDDLTTPRLNFQGIPGFGIKVTRFQLRGIPRAAKAKVRCRKPRRGGRRRSCGSATRTAVTLGFKYLKGKRLRAGSQIIVRVTAKKAVGYYARYNILSRSPGYRLKEGCITLANKVRFKKSQCR